MPTCTEIICCRQPKLCSNSSELDHVRFSLLTTAALSSSTLSLILPPKLRLRASSYFHCILALSRLLASYSITTKSSLCGAAAVCSSTTWASHASSVFFCKPTICSCSFPSFVRSFCFNTSSACSCCWIVSSAKSPPASNPLSVSSLYAVAPATMTSAACVVQLSSWPQRLRRSVVRCV